MTRLQPTLAREHSSSQAARLNALLSEAGLGRTICQFAKGQLIYSEGEVANAVFYIQQGRVKISTLSEEGKEAVLVLAQSGDFLGEMALTVEPVHGTTARALTECSLLRITLEEVRRLMREEQTFSDCFLSFLILKNSQLKRALADQLFNQSEKRLAKTLVSLAGMKPGGISEGMVPRITHQTLAEMVGTTRPRISFFMNRFKKQQLIHYKGRDLYVDRAILGRAQD